ncbi:11215_t:CDS:1 [Paraglomus brasilianum]|uniref:11215_t:CDS:1 n=1 Tax=Paraglomus brasilianum TaxID=144538 RepID=A0A9N9B0C7_9GLOM|nr:11215_t:CDS:1 [Paraglomus brasilianum]
MQQQCAQYRSLNVKEISNLYSGNDINIIFSFTLTLSRLTSSYAIESMSRNTMRTLQRYHPLLRSRLIYFNESWRFVSQELDESDDLADIIDIPIRDVHVLSEKELAVTTQREYSYELDTEIDTCESLCRMVLITCDNSCKVGVIFCFLATAFDSRNAFEITQNWIRGFRLQLQRAERETWVIVPMQELRDGEKRSLMSSVSDNWISRVAFLIEALIFVVWILWAQPYNLPESAYSREHYTDDQRKSHLCFFSLTPTETANFIQYCDRNRVSTSAMLTTVIAESISQKNGKKHVLSELVVDLRPSLGISQHVNGVFSSLIYLRHPRTSGTNNNRCLIRRAKQSQRNIERQIKFGIAYHNLYYLLPNKPLEKGDLRKRGLLVGYVLEDLGTCSERSDNESGDTETNSNGKKDMLKVENMFFAVTPTVVKAPRIEVRTLIYDDRLYFTFDACAKSIGEDVIREIGDIVVKCVSRISD